MNPKIRRNFEIFTPCDFILLRSASYGGQVAATGWRLGEVGYSNKMCGQRNKQAESREGEPPGGGTVELFPGDPFPDYSADPVMDYDLCANG